MPLLHPSIRILLLLAFAGFLPWLPGPGLLAAGGLLGAAWLVLRVPPGPALRGLRRMRWFFLSIAVLYLWFTPGEPLVADIGWLPSLEGAWLALRRCTVLALMILAVFLLLGSTPRDQLTAGLLRLSAPLRLLGLAPERFARRLVAALDAVPGMQALVSDMRIRRREAGLLAAAAGAIAAVERAAESEASLPPVPRLAPPPAWQWLLPLLVAGGGAALLLWQAA